MKNPTTFMTKDGVSDADLMHAARDMYEALVKAETDLIEIMADAAFAKAEYPAMRLPAHFAGIVAPVAVSVGAAIAKARGEDRS